MKREIMWIPCYEKMPPKGLSVLVCLETEMSLDRGDVTRAIQEAEFDHDGEWVLFCSDGTYKPGSGNGITHWAEMPEPPSR